MSAAQSSWGPLWRPGASAPQPVETPEMCPICRELKKVGEGWFRLAECKHGFHEDCVIELRLKWKVDSGRCPCCLKPTESLTPISALSKQAMAYLHQEQYTQCRDKLFEILLLGNEHISANLSYFHQHPSTILLAAFSAAELETIIQRFLGRLDGNSAVAHSSLHFPSGTGEKLHLLTYNPGHDVQRQRKFHRFCGTAPDPNEADPDSRRFRHPELVPLLEALEAAGLPCELSPEAQKPKGPGAEPSTVSWGGVKMFVPVDQYHRAKDLLQQHMESNQIRKLYPRYMVVSDSTMPSVLRALGEPKESAVLHADDSGCSVHVVLLGQVETPSLPSAKHPFKLWWLGRPGRGARDERLLPQRQVAQSTVAGSEYVNPRRWETSSTSSRGDQRRAGPQSFLGRIALWAAWLCAAPQP